MSCSRGVCSAFGLHGGKLRILRTMFIPAALNGAEACSVSGCSLCNQLLCGLFVLANPGAVLTLLDRPLGSDPAYHIVWCRFRMMCRFLAYCSDDLDLVRIYRLLGEVVADACGHGPVHLLVQSAGLNGFAWDLLQCSSALSSCFSQSVFQECCLGCVECYGCDGSQWACGFPRSGSP